MAGERIGFIGLGNMGNPMAINLVSAGYPVICYDIAGTKERAPEGAEIADSVTQIAGSSEFAIISVATRQAVEEITEELAAANRRTVSIVVDTSTIGSKPPAPPKPAWEASTLPTSTRPSRAHRAARESARRRRKPRP